MRNRLTAASPFRHEIARKAYSFNQVHLFTKPICHYNTKYRQIILQFLSFYITQEHSYVSSKWSPLASIIVNRNPCRVDCCQDQPDASWTECQRRDRWLPGPSVGSRLEP